MVHVQNATLAGGVAVAAVAHLLLRPHIALLIGCVAAFLSVFGFAVLTVGCVNASSSKPMRQPFCTAR